MHSDGDIRTVVDDLIDGGVEVINLQDLINGIDWIADKFAGRTCIDWRNTQHTTHEEQEWRLCPTNRIGYSPHDKCKVRD